MVAIQKPSDVASADKVAAFRKAEARTAEKASNFKKLAEKRTNKVLKAIQSLGQLSNKNSYAYTEDQTAKILTAIKHAEEKLYAAFHRVGNSSDSGFVL